MSDDTTRVKGPLAGRAAAAGVALTAALFAVTACGGPKASPEEIAAGRAEFLKTCSTCHGKEAEGMPKLGKNLHENAFVRSKSDEEMLQFLKVGRPAFDPLNTRGVDMPPKGGNPALTEEGLKHIVAYVRSIQ